MANALCWVLLLATFFIGGGSRRRLVHPSETLATPPAGTRLLWIGTHPDDEILLAPVLAQLCLDRDLRCHFLVLTRGEAGICLLPDGCQPSLAVVRTEEMKGAATLFRGQLTIWDFADGTLGTAAVVRAKWSEAAGGEQKLIELIATHIDNVAPKLVFTFDPRHGSTCHPDHQATGSLILDALRITRNATPTTFLLENRVHVLDGGRTILFLPASETGVVRFDARQVLAISGSTAWEYLITNAQLHASQFGDAQLQALGLIPEANRVLHFLPLENALDLNPGEHCRE